MFSVSKLKIQKKNEKVEESERPKVQSDLETTPKNTQNEETGAQTSTELLPCERVDDVKVENEGVKPELQSKIQPENEDETHAAENTDKSRPKVELQEAQSSTGNDDALSKPNPQNSTSQEKVEIISQDAHNESTEPQQLQSPEATAPAQPPPNPDPNRSKSSQDVPASDDLTQASIPPPEDDPHDQVPVGWEKRMSRTTGCNFTSKLFHPQISDDFIPQASPTISTCTQNKVNGNFHPIPHFRSPWKQSSAVTSSSSTNKVVDHSAGKIPT